jgi:hypothetical protein
MGTGSFSGVKSGRDVTLTPHPLLVPWSRNGSAITLLPLWAVRPVQSLSACTRVHFTLIMVGPATEPCRWILTYDKTYYASLHSLVYCVKCKHSLMHGYGKYICYRLLERIYISWKYDCENWVYRLTNGSHRFVRPSVLTVTDLPQWNKFILTKFVFYN